MGKIHAEGLADFAAWDTSFLWDEFPRQVDVLSLHGTVDDVVPMYVLFPVTLASKIDNDICRYDSVIHARALSDRSPGTHSLHLIEDADHNYSGVCA